MYELATKDYPAKDLLAADGTHFIVTMEEELRAMAIASGYDVHPHPGDEDELDWDQQLYFNYRMQPVSDEDPYFKATLSSRIELPKAG